MSENNLSSEDYETAILIQNACNLSGIVHSFAKVMPKLWAEASKMGRGTEWVNSHPICILYSSKISSLTNSEDFEKFWNAHDLCKQKIEKP